MAKEHKEQFGHYVVLIDENTPDKDLVVMTTDGPAEPEPLFWVARKDVDELIRDLSEFRM
jgi:hypothetical protein